MLHACNFYLIGPPVALDALHEALPHGCLELGTVLCHNVRSKKHAEHSRRTTEMGGGADSALTRTRQSMRELSSTLHSVIDRFTGRGTICNEAETLDVVQKDVGDPTKLRKIGLDNI